MVLQECFSSTCSLRTNCRRMSYSCFEFQDLMLFTERVLLRMSQLVDSLPSSSHCNLLEGSCWWCQFRRRTFSTSVKRWIQNSIELTNEGSFWCLFLSFGLNSLSRYVSSNISVSSESESFVFLSAEPLDLIYLIVARFWSLFEL